MAGVSAQAWTDEDQEQKVETVYTPTCFLSLHIMTERLIGASSKLGTYRLFIAVSGYMG
jgi:hypothetical protein